ncbi:hypothetical protein Tco_0379247 [Tanacetum coccineum]
MRVEGIVKRGTTRRIFEPFVSSVVVNVAAVVVIGAAVVVIVVVIVVAVVVKSLVGLAKVCSGPLSPSLGLWYPKCSGFDLKGYSDSDYVGCKIDRKSTVAMSSAEAKYVVVAGCCANILWMKSQLIDYDIIYEKVPIFCDNTSAISISKNPVLHSRTKHIDIRYYFIRDHILKGDIELHFIPTQYQLADIFTKPMDEPTFKRLIVELDVEGLPAWQLTSLKWGRGGLMGLVCLLQGQKGCDG